MNKLIKTCKGWELHFYGRVIKDKNVIRLIDTWCRISEEIGLPKDEILNELLDILCNTDDRCGKEVISNRIKQTLSPYLDLTDFDFKDVPDNDIPY